MIKTKKPVNHFSTALAVVALLAFAYVGVYLFWEGVEGWRFSQLMETEGKTHPATIAKKWTDSGFEGGTDYNLSIEIKGAWDTPVGTYFETVNEKTYRSFDEGDKVTIRYLPGHPGVFEFAGEPLTNDAYKGIGGGVFILLIVVPVLIGIAYFIWLQAHLEKNGIKTTAIITRKIRHNDDSLDIHYQYKDQQNQTHEAWERYGNSEGASLTEGASIPIAYDPKKPSRKMVLN